LLTTLARLTRDKKILILGFGKEGRSTYQALSRTDSHGTLTVADFKPFDFQFDRPVSVITGPAYQKTLEDFDIVFKSPGVVLEKSVHDLRCRITSQTEVFLGVYSRQTIGITGTKGKSTTSSLLHHILKRTGRDCILAGNIGIPLFDIADSVGDETLIINELSSHQLEHINTSPHIAVLINIFQDHLDHYASYEHYIAAKKNIYRHQTPDDILICNLDFLPAKDECQGTVFSVSNGNRGADIQVTEKGVSSGTDHIDIPWHRINLFGSHNFFNIGIIYAITRLLKLPDNDLLDALGSYEPLPHRLENIGTYDGITYYDDAISTICESTIQAIRSLPEIDSVLIGGMDRGIDYMPLIDFLPTTPVRNIILMYDSGKRIHDLIIGPYKERFKGKSVVFLSSLEAAVRYAKKHTETGKTCLLSPAAPSFSHFLDFNDRGESYKKYIQTLT
jgi:UDP-N-acetylmuramoylalanine--D-glutamate ligase